MIIDLSECRKLVENIGETKKQILEACYEPKTYAELLAITDKVSSTLSVHISDLMKDGLLSRTEGIYSTTEQGKQIERLIPYVRATPEGKKSPELIRMIPMGLRPPILTLKENIKVELAGLTAIKHDQTLKKIYDNIVKSIEQSVTLWLPKGLEPDKSMHKEVNHLIGMHIKKNPKSMNDKLTILIEFDLPKAFDRIIHEEKDEDVKIRLLENKDKILNRLYKNWNKIVR